MNQVLSILLRVLTSEAMLDLIIKLLEVLVKRSSSPVDDQILEAVKRIRNRDEHELFEE